MREIPRDEWAGFLDSFSRQHEGWLVSLEVLGAEIGAQAEAQELPLEGVTAELRGGGEDAVTIILGVVVKLADGHELYDVDAKINQVV